MTGGTAANYATNSSQCSPTGRPRSASPSFWGIKRMKTKWGACNAQDGRIWLNSELAKKPVGCLEYIVVHEFAHLLEPSHNAHFVELMDEFLPDWRSRSDHLNSSPLAHESWTY